MWEENGFFLDLVTSVTRTVSPDVEVVAVTAKIRSTNLLFQVKSSHICLYSAFYHTDCIKAASQ